MPFISTGDLQAVQSASTCKLNMKQLEMRLMMKHGLHDAYASLQIHLDHRFMLATTQAFLSLPSF